MFMFMFMYMEAIHKKRLLHQRGSFGGTFFDILGFKEA